MLKTGKAIGMTSGGLDSMLALALVKRQGIEVKAVSFHTGFCIEETRQWKEGGPDPSIPRSGTFRMSADLDVDIEYVDISGPSYLDMVVTPRYGYGANANPCVDCRIFMLKKAREIMEREGADFVFTGEVLGQRPKSQRRDTLRSVERDSGLEGRLLRPLSAKLLAPTIPEQEGIVDRERLLDISGRSRHPQMALANELGIRDWPQPAGGSCYLTDENFSKKFFDLLKAREALGKPRKVDRDDVLLLSTGRHFRLSPSVKLVVGRTEGENAVLERLVSGRRRLEAVDFNGPVGLLEGEPTDAERQLAGRIVARYGKGKGASQVEIEWREGDRADRQIVAPESDEARIESLRI